MQWILKMNYINRNIDSELEKKGIVKEQKAPIQEFSRYQKKKAEVDYVIRMGEKIIPIEVKSGTMGKMQSMHLFIKEKQVEYGIRTSLENFSIYNQIKVYPLYAIGNVKNCK